MVSVEHSVYGQNLQAEQETLPRYGRFHSLAYVWFQSELVFSNQLENH